MTGPAHYREAERLISRAGLPESKTLIVTPSPEVIALAQVHAGLAITAAIVDLFALAGPDSGMSADQWRDAVKT